MTHNYEDVLGMTKLLSILSYKECIHGIADITGVSVNPYTAYDGSLMNELIISFENKFSVPKSVSFHDNDIYLTIGTTKSYVRAEIFEGEMRHFYSDYKNYYYLPKEDMANTRVSQHMLTTNTAKNARHTTAMCVKPVPSSDSTLTS